MDKLIVVLLAGLGFAVISAVLDIALGIEHPEPKWRQWLHHAPYTVLGAVLWYALH